jgi:hypothetical protein
MRRTLLASVLCLAGLFLGDVRSSAQPLPAGAGKGQPPIVSVPAPVIRPVPDGEALPPPKTLTPAPLPTAPTVAVMAPRDFAKMFVPGPGNYEVIFLHPCSKKPVLVPFTLPPGQPKISYCCNSLLFDYGRCGEVEIRFKLGGKVVVTTIAR